MSYQLDTVAVHGGQGNDAATGAVVTPIYQSTTFAQEQLDSSPPWCYSRTGNPTRKVLEDSLAAAEGASFGLAFASGLAAANALLQTLRAGDHVAASHDLYGGCWRLFTRIFHRFSIDFTFIDTTDVANVRAALTSRTRLLWLETPSNPLLKISDIAACAAAARERNVRTIVDNTFATPVFQRPLDLCADLVLHSTTKYFGGHCDVLGGALITNDADLYEELKFVQNATGGVPSPQDCFLLLRGIRTLPLRVRAHEAGARTIAEYLQSHPAVERVHYPGLPEHPHHERARAQSQGFGGVVSVEIRGGRDRAGALVRSLRLWTLAESLGGVKSLFCHPATMTHAAIEPAERRRIGIGDNLIRLSIGLEHPDDLIADLERAFDASRTNTLAAREEEQPA